MAATPEGLVKKRVQALLKKHSAYWFMPVQNGMGAPGVDFHCCVKGRAFFIETKAGNKQPTPRQEHTMNIMRGAGAPCFVINDVEGFEALSMWLNEVSDACIS